MIQLFSLLLISIGVLVGALGVAVLKKGATQYSLGKLFFRRIFWEGVALFGLSLLMYVAVLRREDLSVVYPLGSTTYLITTAISVKYFGEKMNHWKWMALAGVMMGVTLIAIGS